MALDQHASNLIDITAKAFNGDVTSISPLDGISLIDSWISFLKADNKGTGSVVDGLSELKAELQSGNPDSKQIEHIVSDLTKQTSQLTKSADTDSQPKLNVLSGSLQGFSQLLDGSKKANTGGQAPMTSTVGGDSTNSGTGSSTTDTTDDDLSDRTGGTTSNEPATDMDDTTGSNGGPQADRSLAGNDDTEQADDRDSSARHVSRSDSSRVEGVGLSGGTSDTDVAQSGGRSQY